METTSIIDHPGFKEIMLRAYDKAFLQGQQNERERCAKVADEFDDFVYEGRRVDGYSKGTYMMIDGRATAKAIGARIRSGQ